MADDSHAGIKWIISLFLIILYFTASHVVAIEINAGGLQGNWDTTLTCTSSKPFELRVA